MAVRLTERFRELIIPATGHCHMSLKHLCLDCGEAFPNLEALTSHMSINTVEQNCPLKHHEFALSTG